MGFVSGNILQEIKGGVTRGIDNFTEEKLRNGDFTIGDAVVVDLADAILGADIAGLCRFNDRMYMLMNRLMQININEQNMRFMSLGYNSHIFGESDKLDPEIPNYSYTYGMNYLLGGAYEIKNDEIKGISATQGIGDDGYYSTSHNISPDNFDYGNLYPDDIDALTGEAARNVWKFGSTNSILLKTKRLFDQRKINTIISRFGTAADSDSHNLIYKGSKRTKYGESHGRNLLTAESEKRGVSQYTFNGYNNPYCRVWTHHYQYDKYYKTIRPFHYIDNDGDYMSTSGVKEFHKWDGFEYDRRYSDGSDKGNGYGWKNGDAGWEKSVLDTTKGGDGIVKITPKYINGERSNIHTKECMFSIENLAWRGYDPYSFERALSWEQRGPLGGRIMWFPPYGITFNETTNVNWSSSTFIGRGEDVFTYVNAQRSGTLSFLMVVDHPSVIDYATWHDETGRVDDTDMLRFFAGCDSLNPENKGIIDSIMSIVKPTPLTDEYLNEYQQPVFDYPIVKTPPQKPEDPPQEVKTVTFYVFYPNNYSGQYDDAGYAVAYLLSGSGAGKFNDGLQDLAYDFKNIGSVTKVGYEVVNKDGEGVPLSPESNIPTLEESGNYIYAFAKDYSLIEKDSNKDKYKWFYRVDGKYSSDDSTYKNTYGQRLYDTDGKTVNPTFVNGNISNTNYLDIASYGLNSFSTAWDVWKKDESEENIYCSFADFACGVAKLKGYTSAAEYLASIGENSNIEVDGKSVNKTDYIKTLLETYKIVGVEGVGYSNSHGYNTKKAVNKKRNEILSKNRVETIKKWLAGEGIYTGEFEPSNESGVDDDVEPHMNSGFNAKLWRSARITLKFETDNTQKIAESNNEYEEQMSNYKKYVGYSEDGKDAEGRTIYKNSDGTLWIELEDGMLVRSDVGEEIGISSMRGRSQSQYHTYAGEGIAYGNDDSMASGNRYYTDTAINSYVKDGSIEHYNGKLGGGERNRLRYDQEYYFFRTLEKKDPLVFNRLMDKIKYFDPAFHSMTPEGFNARLTFLNQCTRQGNTISMSDINGQTANNLAFGRPPFCVLRIGDFYNQMIVIENINIDYSVSDGIQWDMNTEGIGMQPLLAQINISFKFIGGGDIAGPIRRLQNAMSFNYYANARFYDNRADRVVYESENDYKVIGGAGKHNIDIHNEQNYAYTTQMYEKHRDYNLEIVKASKKIENESLKP